MASKKRGKPGKGLGLFGDDGLLDDLLRDDDYLTKGKPVRGGPVNRSSASDDFFRELAEAAEKDGGNVEDSDVSEADPNDILKNMKDMDDMDADLFSSRKKPSSAPAQTKNYGSSIVKKDPPESENRFRQAGEDEPILEERKSSSAPATAVRGLKKFSFIDDGDGVDGLDQTPDTKDLDDPLADLLEDTAGDDRAERKSRMQKTPPEKSLLSLSMSPIVKKKETLAKKRDELTFDDDEDDLMDALGFDDENDNTKKKKKDVVLQPKKESSDPPQRARTRLDEILQIGTSPRLLERPSTGERKEPTQPLGKQQLDKTSTAKEPIPIDDLTFGSYQPTLAATPEGRQSRRQSVRFSTEDISTSTPERKPKPATPATPPTPTTSSTRPRASADWLGLKTGDDFDFPEEDGVKEPKGALERKPSLSGTHSTAPMKAAESPAATSKPPRSEGPETLKKDEKEEQEETKENDWLAGALSRKKAAPAPRSEGRRSRLEDSPGLAGSMDLDSGLSKGVSSPASRRRQEDTVMLTKDSGEEQPSPTVHSTPVSERKAKQDNHQPLPSEPQSPSIAVHRAPSPQPDLSSPTTSPSPALMFSPVNIDVTQPQSHSSHVPGEHQPVGIQMSPGGASVSHPQPQLQSHRYPLSPQDSRAPGRPGQATEMSSNHEAPQWQPVPNLMMPGSLWLQQQTQGQNTAPAAQQQVAFTADSLQQLLLQQQLMQSQLLGLGSSVDTGSLQRHKEQQSGDLHTLQARIIQLEGQVKSVQLERDQNQMLLDSVQIRHKQDTELMENTHRARVKLLEESASQRELRARQECEDLMERLATVTRLAEQERSELLAQHQRRLAQIQQDRDREVERLRDLQRKSILEMKKDHEDQVLRLKRLKDEEIDAVTSATSQTRSLTVVIEQMEQFSHRLGDLSSRVESTHEHTAQGLEHGARQRDEQLRVMQDRLGQQQRAMAEERAHLKEAITRMDSQLAEQQRQLEKERWRVTAEQAKAESAQRGLEEERRSMTMHLNMEREELERAKTALLEEQQSVMQRCAEERRKLAAEWSQFHIQKKQRQERAEWEANRATERDAQRQGSIISMAQEQADLKLRAGELKQKEEALAREREALERQREELDREKERLSGTALRLKTRAQEVEAFSKVATEKYEEGEQALHEARQVETDHQTRLRSIHSQMERLRQQEQHLHQERMRMNDMRRDLERLRQGLPVTPLQQAIPPIHSTDFTMFTSTLPLGSTLNVPPPATRSGSTELQARLAMLKHNAQKDRDYLQDEQFFLDTLKKATFHTD